MKLSDKAIRVSLSISQWSGMAIEREGARVAEDAAGAKRGVVRARKYVLPGCEELKAVQSFNNAFRAWFYEQTLPWDDLGARILPHANGMDFMRAVGDKKREGEALIDKFVSVYPSWFQKAQLALGDMWDAKAYPDPDFIRGKFGYTFTTEPLPEVESLRNFSGFTPEEVDERVAEATSAMQERLKAAQGEIWKRVFETTHAMAERLAVPIGTQGAVFRDSLVNNVVELVDLMPKLNVLGDPSISGMAEDLKRQLLGVMPDALRIDPVVRAERAARAKALAEKAQAFL